MRNRSRNRRLSAVEETLWRRVVANVQPLDPAARPLPETVLAPGNAAGGRPAHSAFSQPDPEPPPVPAEAIGGKQNLTGNQSAIDRRTKARMQRGQLPIEGRLDLHGMTQKEAYSALLRFISASRSYGRRHVLVVTGKGWNPDAGRRQEAFGVLRRNVPHWLENPPFTEHVAAVRDAHTKHGGSGALYVLLRESRRQ